MTREIKFRAINKKTGQWFYWRLLDMFDSSFQNAFNNEVELDYETICQGTGLKDKNGVEIYEGDIVKVLDRDYIDFEDNKTNTKVVFKDGCFVLETFYINSLDNQFDYFRFYKEHGRDWFEVIGNIYENPELLDNK